MLFNSLDFALFLPLVFALYWFVTQKNLKLQNALLLVASYVFYGWWDWRFLSLIFISSLADYIIGRYLAKDLEKSLRKMLLGLSIFINLGFLGFFKYFNFFAKSFAEAFHLFGSSFEVSRLEIILPVGISFYTFQTMSYSIDLYRRKIKASKDPIAFCAYVSFFPQLVAGPIERASNLLPQFNKTRTFEYHNAVDGMRQILWGLFKKVVIADNCAQFVNYIFEHSSELNGSTLFFGAIFFTFQIYGDFSGYSDIAIGTSRLFGFNLKQNFAFPYFSRDMAEFWRRWHISLSTWFRDYLYIPLGGSKVGTARRIMNTFIIFIVSGFWHGANWTFIFWGFLNACYFLPLLLTNRNRRYLEVVAQDRIFPSLRELVQISGTFAMTVLAWIFFRAESITHAFQYIKGMCSSTLISLPEFPLALDGPRLLIVIAIFMIIEWKGRRDQYGIETLGIQWIRPTRWAFYCVMVFMIGMYMQTKESPFIYFQF